MGCKERKVWSTSIDSGVREGLFEKLFLSYDLMLRRS